MLKELLKDKMAIRRKNESRGNPFYVSSEEIETLLQSEGPMHDVSEETLPGLSALSQLFNLTEMEKRIIAIVAAPAIDVRYESLPQI